MLTCLAPTGECYEFLNLMVHFRFCLRRILVPSDVSQEQARVQGHLLHSAALQSKRKLNGVLELKRASFEFPCWN